MRTRRNRHTALGFVLALFLTLLTCAARADDAPPPPPGVPPPPVPTMARTWPVGSHPLVLRGWEPPATLYARGHRGVDLATPAGAPVRAVAAGRVSFA
ncbi:M23 family metallopeptidase, partial [Streptomyces sp. MBT62]